MRLTAIFLGLLTYEVVTAFIFTWIANRADLSGLAWVCFGCWIIAMAAVLLRYRKVVSLVGLTAVLLTSPVLAVLIYIQAGYHVFGWRGLMKP